MRSIWKGSGLLRAGEHRREAVLRHRGARRQLPPGAPHATARGSATSGSPRPTARRSPTPTSPRATSCPAARRSCSPTRTSPTCRCPPRASSTCCSSCRSSRSTRSTSRRATTSSRRSSAVKPYVLLRDALEASGKVGAGQGRDPQPRAAGHAAGARRRDRARDDDLAGRGARGRPSAFLDEDVDAAPAGARDGRVARRRACPATSTRAVHRRLPRGAAAGHRRQGRGTRGRRGRRSRSRPPATSST